MKFNDFETNSRILCAKIAKQRERGHSNKSRDTFFAHDAFRRLLMHSDATALKLTHSHKISTIASQSGKNGT